MSIYIDIDINTILIKHLSKNRFNVDKAFNLIRWIIIIYTMVSVLQFTSGFIFDSTDFQFDLEKGPSVAAYLFMFFFACILPITLFNKRLGSNAWYIFTVSILMNIGVFFERFVIIATTLQRDHLQGFTSSHELILNYFLMLFLQGVIIAVILLAIVELMEALKNRLLT